MRNNDTFRGCLIGGAIGDALGYTVEFSDEKSIFARFGLGGIQHYELDGGIAHISDDTQMSLFTANSLLFGETRGHTHGLANGSRDFFNFAYRDWLRTQIEEYPINDDPIHVSWLVNCPELYDSREPGRTCISSLMHENYGTISAPLNNSKGCGGVMRVGPIGVYYVDKQFYTILDADRIGAEAAAVTHGHELGYIPAAGLVHVIYRLASGEEVSVLNAVKDMLETVPGIFPEAKHMGEFVSIMEKAIDLAQSDSDDLDAIHTLGEGWVAEETLAIASFCAMRYQDNFAKGIIAAVNHKGDSDSTGAVAGNILGALHGYDAIPAEFKENLELRDIILELADDLHHDCQISAYSTDQDPTWVSKYIRCDFCPHK